MARFIADYNKVVGIHESGTYANQEAGALGAAGSTFWIGQVTENSVENAQNHIETKYMGTADRSFDTIILGPNDVTGTLTYHPHDMRLMFFAIGSIVEVSGATATTCTHGVTEINSNVWQSPFTSGTDAQTAPMSFTIEDSKQSPGTGRNFIRTVNGAVINTATLTLTQGEKATVEIAYIGQNEKFSSGTTTTLVNSGTQALTPYLWENTVLTVAGSPMDTATEIKFEVNNNVTAPHYVNGSRVIGVPYAGVRSYTLSITQDLDGTDSAFLYEQYYAGGSSFNATLDMDADIDSVTAGSKHTIFYMSGCKITGMDNPSTSEGTTETTIEIRPQHVTGSVYDRTHKYCPW